MTDFLMQMGVSNACFSLALAIVAVIVGATAKRPYLTHLLWLLVFVKLVTPPLVTLPVGIPASFASTDNLPVEINLPVVSDADVEASSATAPAAQAPSLMSTIGAKLSASRPWFAFSWLLGSLLIFAWSVCRILQFTRLLKRNTEPAPRHLRTAAATLAKPLGLKTLPEIFTTSAHLSPMVWWFGGKVRIVVPATLLEKMDQKQWQWILAHELAHVRRGDYLVRWLEWLACVCFWWNPVVWWAQRLPRMEEICCDAVVLSCLKPKAESYANTLLTAVEFLACPAIRPPAMASEINSGGFLERRFRMIVSETPSRVTSRWSQVCVLLCAIFVLPLGVVYAQDYEAVGKRLRAAVAAGELTGEQAKAMLGVLKKSDGAKNEQSSTEAKAYLMKVKKELGAAVEAGKISEEDAITRYKGAEKAIKERMAAGRGEAREAEGREAGEAREYLMKVKKELGAAVEAGKISEEDAITRYKGAEKAIKERMAAGRGEAREAEGREAGEAREYLMKVKKELGAAVEAGKISEEDAITRYKGAEKAIKERMAAGRGERDLERLSREDFARAAKEIRKAVAEGKVSKEHAAARLGAMRKMIGQQPERSEKEVSKEDLERAGTEIRKAIAEGKLTAEEGRKKLRAMRKKIGEQRERSAEQDVDWEGIEKRIEGAVKSGKMTREEADAKYKELRERMAGDRDR